MISRFVWTLVLGVTVGCGAATPAGQEPPFDPHLAATRLGAVIILPGDHGGLVTVGVRLVLTSTRQAPPEVVVVRDLLQRLAETLPTINRNIGDGTTTTAMRLVRATNNGLPQSAVNALQLANADPRYQVTWGRVLWVNDIGRVVAPEAATCPVPTQHLKTFQGVTGIVVCTPVDAGFQPGTGGK